MAITRCIVTMPYFTGVPEDAASNSFYFGSVAPLSNVETGAVAVRLDAFYNAIDAWLSPVLAPAGMIYRFYRMEDPEPRVPYLTVPGALLTLGATGTPEEVSLCLSYAAEPASGESAARRRGRIYVGPLALAAVTAGTGTAFSQPLAAFRTALATAASVLADQSEIANWGVFSQTDNILRKIVGGWVDNSFDTQRRRGRRATARTTWVGQA